MRSVRPLQVVLALGALVAACGSPAAPPPTAPPSGVAAASPARTAGPTAPAVASAGASAGPANAPTLVPTRVGTTKTAWGVILDAVPDTFPVFPDATPASPVPEAVSGAWIATATVDEVAVWYHDAVLAAAFASADLGSALEDGSRVLDVQGDLPECKVQVAVRPAGGSTMISVLYGAGCAGQG
jgi:hypothetical protein